MNINIKGTHIELTDAIEEYVKKKLEQSLSKLIDLDDNKVYIYAEIEKTQPDQHTGDQLYRAEVTVDNVGEVFYADAAAGDTYAAIDLVRDEIWRKIKKDHDKERTLWRKGMAKVKKMMRGE